MTGDGTGERVDGAGPGPVDDAAAEALLAGIGTDREELATLERFVGELRAAPRGLSPRPSPELTRLFSDGRVIGVDEPAPVRPRPSGGSGRKPVRRMAKVAVVTTTAALAVTFAAAAQILPTTQARTSISVSGPATPVRVGTDQAASPVTPQVSAGAGAHVSVQPTTTSTVVRPPTTIRSVGGVDVASLSAEALARLPLDVLRTLPVDGLVRLPMEVLRTLPGDILARLPIDVLRTLPPDALGRLPGEVLGRLPLDLLQILPADVQARLPVDVLRLLVLGRAPTTVTTATTVARP